MELWTIEIPVERTLTNFILTIGLKMSLREYQNILYD